MMADVFFIQMRRLRSFRRGATVTTEDCRWFYKKQSKGNRQGRKKTKQDRGGGTQKNRVINPEKRSKQNTTQKIQREGEPTQKKRRKTPEKKNKKNRATRREQEKKAAYTPTRIVPAIVVSLQQEKQKKTQKLTSTVNRCLHC
jgi:hypothetical protein